MNSVRNTHRMPVRSLTFLFALLALTQGVAQSAIPNTSAGKPTNEASPVTAPQSPTTPTGIQNPASSIQAHGPSTPATTPTAKTAAAADAAAVSESAAAELAAMSEEAKALRKKLENDLATQERAVAALEKDYGVFDPRLVDTLTKQGRELHSLSRYNQAIDVYERARHITRVNDGLYNLKQIEIIDAAADSMAAVGRWHEATNQKEYALMLSRRHFGIDSTDFIPALYSLGNWYQRTGNVFGARDMYESASRILAAHVGNDDERRADSLRRLAYAYRLERFPEQQFAAGDDDERSRFDTDATPSNVPHGLRAPFLVNRFGPGERALKDAILIYARQKPPNSVQFAATLAELGDWYLLFGMWDRAQIAYHEALAQPGADISALFGTSQPIYWRPPPTPERPSSDNVPERHGFVEMTFDVSERGEVASAQVTRAAPQGVMDKQALKALRASRYRPRFDSAGQPVASPGQKFRYEFVYYKEPRT